MELIVVLTILAILAILAALLIPALTGYIDKAKQKTLIAETKDIWTASQAAMSECYALYPESFDESCKFTSTIDGKVMHNLGRISNGALNALQKNSKGSGRGKYFQPENIQIRIGLSGQC